MAEIASAYVSLIPSFKGGAAAMGRELGAAVEPAGRDAGERAGEQASKGFAGAFKRFAAGAALFGGLDFLRQSFADAMDRAALPEQMEARFGLTEQVAAQAAQTAGDLYAKGWGESLGQVGDSVATVQRALAGLGTGEDVAKVSTQAQALADTFGEEVGPMVNAASQLIKTGLADSMEGAFDLMTKGFQSGANASGDFLDTLTEYAVQFEKLGLDGATAIGLINQGLKDGARNSDLVADAIKEFSIRAVDGSKTTAEGFEAIGLNADAMAAKIAQGGESASAGLQQVLDGLRSIEDPVDRSQAAVALFGTQAEDLGDALYALDPAAVSATGGMNDVGGAAQDVADTMGSTMQANLTSLARTFQSGLGSALSLVVPLLQGLFAVLQPLLPVLGPMAIAIGVVTAAQWAWNAALNANPIVLVVSLIAGLIAIIVLAWQKSETFRDIVMAVWEAIKTAIAAVVDWITGTMWPAIQAAWDGIVSGVTWVKDLVVGAWNAIVSGLKSAANWVRDRWNWLVGVIKGAARKIGGFLGGIWDALTAGAKGAVNGAIGIVNSVIGGLNTLIDGANYIPGVNIPHIPRIPYLAQGGVVTGPTLAMVGEGNESEAVLPLSKLDAMLDSRGGDATVVIDARGLNRGLEQWLQHAVRVKGGGSVQRFAGR